MTEADRQREAMCRLMEPVVGEEVVCGEWFTPAKGMEDDGLAAVRWVRRRLSGGRHPDDLIRSRNILVLTPTRLVAFTARHARATPPVEPRRQVGEWPLDQVGLKYRGHKGYAFFNATANTYRTKVVRATLTFAGEDRPLVVDFPDTPLARELLKAAQEAVTGAQSPR